MYINFFKYVYKFYQICINYNDKRAREREENICYLNHRIIIPHIMKIIMWEAEIYDISQGSDRDMPSKVSGKFFTLKLPLLLDYIRDGNDLPFQPAANWQNLRIEVGSSSTRISSLRFFIRMQMASCSYPARAALANISEENEQALYLRWSIPGCTRDRCFLKRAWHPRSKGNFFFYLTRTLRANQSHLPFRIKQKNSIIFLSFFERHYWQSACVCVYRIRVRISYRFFIIPLGKCCQVFETLFLPLFPRIIVSYDLFFAISSRRVCIYNPTIFISPYNFCNSSNLSQGDVLHRSSNPVVRQTVGGGGGG